MEQQMSDDLRYVIELGGDAAGLVVKEKSRFRFFAAEKRFASLDRRLYHSPAEAENACRSLLRPANGGIAYGWPVFMQRVLS
jgi:hypothetical protein